MTPSELYAKIAPLWAKRPDLERECPASVGPRPTGDAACMYDLYARRAGLADEKWAWCVSVLDGTENGWVDADVAAAALTGFLAERLPPGKCLYRVIPSRWEVCDTGLAISRTSDVYALYSIVDAPTALSALVAFHMQEPTP